MSTMRERLHAAATASEAARAYLTESERMYDKARDELNALIDEVCPLSAPNGVVTAEQVRAVLANRKIHLIKMIRDAAQKKVRELVGRGALPSACYDETIPHSEAKALVEAWIEGQE